VWESSKYVKLSARVLADSLSREGSEQESKSMSKTMFPQDQEGDAMIQCEKEVRQQDSSK